MFDDHGCSKIVQREGEIFQEIFGQSWRFKCVRQYYYH